ncbi:DUF1648 domain-containing protein [Chryseobacterium bernardetii]|uniref:DUF1648 domain-containing protein n=1 Tax=Chryseobacterium bernardetii TaxID=1241978 RepID=A0A3G6T794_9FLAO|nr:DUF1648 domain-containing protein [Chryseobacterium bernardetii]AZB23717.1 DUF1648 domain-containing protein [Chryseobacterium bernardetii]
MKLSGILLIVNTLLLAVIWVFTGIKYAGLPEVIPTHFDIHGNVDGESGKTVIWLLPCIAAFIHLLFIGIKDPNSPLLNVPQSFRNERTLKLYLFSLELPVMILFLDIIVESIRIAEGKQTELSDAVFFILGLLFAVIGTGLIKSFRDSKRKSND